MVSYDVKGFSSGISALVSGTLGITAMKTFLKGVFQRAFTDYNLVDLSIAICFILFLFAIMLILKDIVDGGSWTKMEKEKAIKGLSVTLIFLVIIYFTTSYTATIGYLQPEEDQFRSLFGYGGGADSDSVAATFVEPQYISVASADADDTYLTMGLNQTGFTFTVLKTTRGLNITLSDDGIVSAKLQFNDASVGVTDLKSSVTDTDDVSITDLGTTTLIVMNWTLSDTLLWSSTYTYDNVNDMFRIYLGFNNSVYNPASTVTVTWNWKVAIDSDLVYYGIVLMLDIAFAYPFFQVMDLSNAPVYQRRRRRR